MAAPAASAERRHATAGLDDGVRREEGQERQREEVDAEQDLAAVAAAAQQRERHGGQDHDGAVQPPARWARSAPRTASATISTLSPRPSVPTSAWFELSSPTTPVSAFVAAHGSAIDSIVDRMFSAT